MDIVGLINAIGVIVIGYFTYNQYTKNKQTDYKLEKWKKEDQEINKQRSEHAMQVFGELWELLYKLNADRVYIVQPHPLGHEEMLTIYFEVKRSWAVAMRPHIQQMKISDVPKFSSDLAKNLFMYVTDIDGQIKDRYAQSIFASCGTTGVIIKKLSNRRYGYVGSIFCEFSDKMEIDENEAKDLLHKCATSIQYILPEIRS